MTTVLTMTDNLLLQFIGNKSVLFYLSFVVSQMTSGVLADLVVLQDNI